MRLHICADVRAASDLWLNLHNPSPQPAPPGEPQPLPQPPGTDPRSRHGGEISQKSLIGSEGLLQRTLGHSQPDPMSSPC